MFTSKGIIFVGVALALCLGSLAPSEAFIDGIMREMARQRALQIIRLYPDLLNEIYRGNQNLQQLQLQQQQQLLQQQLLPPNMPGGNGFINGQMNGLPPQLSVQQPNDIHNQLTNNPPNVSSTSMNASGTSGAPNTTSPPASSLGDPRP